MSTEVNGGESSSPWQLRGAAEMFRHVHAQVHWKSLQKREALFTPRSKTCSGSSLVGSAGLPRCMGCGCAEPSPSHRAEQSLHTGWFSTEDFPLQPSTPCLDLLLLHHTTALSHTAPGQGSGCLKNQRAPLGLLFPLPLPLSVAQTSPPPS